MVQRQLEGNPTKEQENFRIGVAVADKPTGPFKDLFNQPGIRPRLSYHRRNILLTMLPERPTSTTPAAATNMPLKAKVSAWAKEKGWFDEIEESWIYGVELKPDFSGIIGEPVALLLPAPDNGRPSSGMGEPLGDFT